MREWVIGTYAMRGAKRRAAGLDTDITERRGAADKHHTIAGIS